MIINVILIPIFLICLFVCLKFSFGKEGKDERGQRITSTAYTYSFPLFPIGWLLIEIYHRHIIHLSFVDYRNFIGLLIPLIFIVQGLVIITLKRRI